MAGVRGPLGAAAPARSARHYTRTPMRGGEDVVISTTTCSRSAARGTVTT